MKQWLARSLLHLFGWEADGECPPNPRFVLIAAPHTSNWDWILMILFAGYYDLRVNWLAKHSLFAPPFGWFMRGLGGIPVFRDQNLNMVDSMVAEFERRDRLILVIPTEGTRGRAEYWKSGFYHIARNAGVPVVPCYLDFSKRRGGFGPGLVPGADVSADMDHFRNFYKDKVGRHPERMGPVRLREENSS